MTPPIFVKVLGFNDVERHALNTIFRLSEGRQASYALWADDAPALPRLALVDGESYEASMLMAARQPPDMKLFWVGPGAPEETLVSFDRPLLWPQVVQAMDDLFLPPEPLDFDLGIGIVEDTRPPEPQEPMRRALIIAAGRDVRLYMRARLSLADLTRADDAASAAEAQQLMRDTAYEVVLVDFDLPDAQGWEFMKQLAQGKPSIARVVVVKQHASLLDRVRGWLAGAALFDKPPHPARLHTLLQKI
ncbi:MAG: response regulator [Burkholderiales bacterium]|nr:response regulator [Burkholderiales bacterium]